MCVSPKTALLCSIWLGFLFFFQFLLSSFKQWGHQWAKALLQTACVQITAVSMLALPVWRILAFYLILSFPSQRFTSTCLQLCSILMT